MISMVADLAEQTSPESREACTYHRTTNIITVPVGAVPTRVSSVTVKSDTVALIDGSLCQRSIV